MTTYSSPTLQLKSSGIIPFCIEERTHTFYVLLARAVRHSMNYTPQSRNPLDGVWSDLGGSPKPQDYGDPIATAAREFSEECMCIVRYNEFGACHPPHVYQTLLANELRSQEFALCVRQHVRVEVGEGGEGGGGGGKDSSEGGVDSPSPSPSPLPSPPGDGGGKGGREEEAKGGGAAEEKEEEEEEEEEEEKKSRGSQQRANLPRVPYLQAPRAALDALQQIELPQLPPRGPRSREFERVYYVKKIPFDPEVGRRFQELRSKLLRVPEAAVEEEMSPFLQHHPALDPVTRVIAPEYLEKNRLQWFSLDSLIDSLDPNEHTGPPLIRIRRTFRPALRVVVAKLAQLRTVH